MTDYNSFKAAELKELLKERGISSTGLTRKQQYIEALQEDDVKPATEEDSENAVAQEDNVEPIAQEEADKQPAAQADDETPIAQDNTEENPAQENGAEKNDEPPQISDDQSDNRKRKRRSPTPPVTEDSVQKKLKAADGDEVAKLPEDFKDDAPAPIEGEAEQTVQPTMVSDDVMDVSGEQQVKEEDIQRAADSAEKQEETSTEPMAVDPTGPADIDDSGPPSTHPPTPALYIRNLLRPLQIPPFQDHLLQLATPSSESIDDSLITTIHLDAFKTHAFVIFTSTTAASRARAGLHDRVWPEETQRKALWVDYVPPSKAHEWITTEQQAGKTKRFEVVYSSPSADNNNNEDHPIATLEEIPQHPPTAPSTTSVPGPGMPNAPTGPRSDRPTPHQQSQPQNLTAHPPRAPLHPTTSLAHFPSTTALPKLFYQPVSAELVDKRLDELDRETSRDWDNGRQKPFGSALDQLRRYTFEDGDVVVDGGVDFGGFGRDRGAGGGGHGGHGGGGRRRRGGRR